VDFMPCPIYSQENNPLPVLEGRLGGSQSLFGHGGKEKNPCPF